MRGIAVSDIQTTEWTSSLPFHR
ncbi:unnamed protein product [Oppiella nova]|uniref:Uncharacterized protein n=1 Tax=Oppiella nova TaxID=334625 RepID=A0A7R9R0M0_9ACAR|nr:unnamed protein product [Oppiella nova]CAG2181340.1 unnamed protein product [Oppiella nova]